MAIHHRQTFHQTRVWTRFEFFSNRTSFEALPKLDLLFQILLDSERALCATIGSLPTSPLPSPSIQVSSVSGIARGGNSGYRRGGEESLPLPLPLLEAFFSRDVVHFENFREIKAKGSRKVHEAPLSSSSKKMRKWRES